MVLSTLGCLPTGSFQQDQRTNQDWSGRHWRELCQRWDGVIQTATRFLKLLQQANIKVQFDHLWWEHDKIGAWIGTRMVETGYKLVWSRMGSFSVITSHSGPCGRLTPTFKASLNPQTGRCSSEDQPKRLHFASGMKNIWYSAWNAKVLVLKVYFNH